MNKDTLIVAGAIVLVIGGVAYYALVRNLATIRSNWSEYRCNPLYMPFTSWIDESQTVSSNFQHCMGRLGKEVLASNNDAFGSLFSMLSESIGTILHPMRLIRALLSRIRGFVLSFTSSTLGKASGSVSAFTYLLNKIQDLLRRMVGEGYIAAMFGATTVGFIESFVTLVITIIKGFVIAMLAISFILAIFQPELLAIVLVLASLLASAGA
jgi:hypothetical protein